MTVLLVTFPPEPVNVVTDGMTYQDKIDILSGSMYDCDDYCDSRPDYFDYDEQSDFEDEYGFVGPVEYGMCGGFQEPDGDFHVRYDFVGPVDVRMCCGPYGPEGTGDDNRLPSLEQDSPGDPSEENDFHRTGCGDPFTGIVCASGLDGTGDRNRPLSLEQGGPGDPCEKTDLTRTGFGDPVISVIHTSGPIGPCNKDSWPPTGSAMPLCQFVSVY